MEEEQARLAAEARRQRILDSANSRMDRVSGLAGADGNEASEQPGEKKASKMAAMRRRRFTSKKAEASGTESAAKKESEATKEAVAPVVVEAKEVTKEAAPPVVEAKAEEKKPDTETTTATESSKKKYMGVAKMRRKMIKEKQQKQETEEEATPVTIPRKFSKVSPLKPKYPIMMHLLTVFFLFLAGFEVGLQQNVIEYRDDLTIHQTVAPQQELRLLNKGISLSSFSPTPTIVKDDVAVTEEPPTPYVSQDEDEFTEEKEEAFKEENLDPLFGVDLDELTAGPGLVMMMGRFAVSAHRFILSIVYHFPIRMWNNILALVASPPVLCLAALAIRQGSHVLGGKLPEKIAEDKMSTQPQDIMTTIKNLVSGFILKSFPTATKLYEAWTHLRSDM